MSDRLERLIVDLLIMNSSANNEWLLIILLIGLAIAWLITIWKID